MLIDFALRHDALKKIGEIGPGTKAGSNDGQVADLAPSTDRYESPGWISLPWRFIRDAFELMLNARGIGLKFGTGSGVHIPKDRRDISNRAVYLRQTFFSVLWNYLLYDLLNTILLCVPGLRGRAGGSIFAYGSNLYEKVLISTSIQLVTGVFLKIGGPIIYIVAMF